MSDRGADPETGGLVLVTGAAGVGKTRHAERRFRAARAGGAHAVWTIAGRAGAPAFWPWTQLLAALPPEITAGHPLAATLVDSDPDATARFPVFDDVLAALTDATTQRPLFVVLDDLHEADAASMLLLGHIAPLLRGTAVRIVATVRTDLAPERPEWAVVWPDLLRHAQTVPVGPLSGAAIAAVLEATTGRVPDPALVDRIAARTGGNALFVCELARYLQIAPDDVDALPETVRAVIDARLALRSPTCRRVLSTVAVLGNRVTVDSLHVVSGEADTLAAQDEAVRHGLLREPEPDRLAFVHEIVRDAVYDLLPLAHRTHWHRAAGDYFAAAGDAADAAHHFRLAGADGRADAARWSEVAGHQSMALLAYEDAAAHFRAASAGAAVAGRVQVHLGAALAAAGDAAGARAAHLAAAALARDRSDGALLADAALGLGAGPAGFEVALHDREQITALEDALALLDPDDRERRAVVLARLSIALTYAGQEERRRALADEAVALARDRADDGVLAAALAARCDVIAGPEHTAERLALSDEIVRIAQRLRDIGLELLGRRLRLVACHEVGDLAAVSAEVTAYEHASRLLRHPLYSWYVPLWRAAAAFGAGRLDECRDLVAEAQAQGRAAGSVNVEALVPTVLWFVAAESADREAARALFDTFELHESMGPWVPVTLALIDAQLGDLGSARARLDACVAAIEIVPRDSEWLASVTQAAEAVALVGGHPIAGRLYELLSPYGQQFLIEGIGAVPRGSVERHLGLLAAALGDPDAARRHFDHALAANRRLGATLVIARTMYDAATSLGSADLRAEATTAYRALGLQHRIDLLNAVPAESAAAFVRNGDGWSLTYAGRTAMLRDSKGLHDLAALLSAPGRPIPALELATAVSGDRFNASGLGTPGDLGDLIDVKARRAYEQRLEQLASDADAADRSGDEKRSAAVAAERDALVAQLSSAYGLGRRPRRAGDPAERARSTVTARIKGSLRRIEAVHPELGRHLRNAIRTGAMCSYEPETPVTWRLTS